MSKDMDKKIEDEIINSFIDDMVPQWDPLGKNDEAPYSSLNTEATQMNDFEAFKYFNSEFEKAAEENKKIDAIGFDRFVKLHRPERGFTEDLRKFDSTPSGMSKLWRDVYGSNTNLMKESAYRGYQRALAIAAGDSKVDKSL